MATVCPPQQENRRPELDDPWFAGLATREELLDAGVTDGEADDPYAYLDGPDCSAGWEEEAGPAPWWAHGDDPQPPRPEEHDLQPPLPDDQDLQPPRPGDHDPQPPRRGEDRPLPHPADVPDPFDPRPDPAPAPPWSGYPGAARRADVPGSTTGAPSRRRRPGRPQVLMWTCPKGGSGKTSLSLRYAAFLASVVEQRSMRVAWLDGNLQQADGARYLGADERASRTIADLAGGPEPDERQVLAALTPPAETGRPVWAMFGPALKAEADPRVVSPAVYGRVLDVLRRHFDHVVVDTPVAEHHNAFFTDFVLPEADQLVVVVPPLVPVVRAVREWLELQSRPVAVGGAAFPAAQVRIVLNMSSPRSGCPVEAVRDAWLSRWTWAGEIPLDPGWTEATNNGTLVSGGSQLAAGFADLVRSTTGDAVAGRRGGSAGGGRFHRLWRSLVR